MMEYIPQIVVSVCASVLTSVVGLPEVAVNKGGDCLSHQLAQTVLRDSPCARVKEDHSE